MKAFFKCISFCAMMCYAFSGYTQKQYDFDLQGHRGARGLVPENSIPAFLKALEIGVTTLELDLAVTKDLQLVVSHEPWFAASICFDSLGGLIDPEKERRYNIYQHTYQQVQSYDCGSKGNARFPGQVKQPVTKPLLTDVIEIAEAYRIKYDLPQFRYNIEIKSHPEGDGIYHPKPEEFAVLLRKTLEGRLPSERVQIQSFDFRALQAWKRLYPSWGALVMLVENGKSLEENLKNLGFIPEVYSPYFQQLDAETVALAQKKGMKVIPWTVNETKDMEQLLQWGVDGIITDYPDRGKTLLKPNNKERKEKKK
jgi:glycerophosphoryl diester phosphodiesterase